MLHFRIFWNYCIYPRLYVWPTSFSGYMTNTLHNLTQTFRCWSWPWRLQCHLTSQSNLSSQLSSQPDRPVGWLAPCLHHRQLGQHASQPACQYASIHSPHDEDLRRGKLTVMTALTCCNRVAYMILRVIYFPPATMLPGRFKVLSKVEILHLLARICIKLHIFCTHLQTSS